MGIFHRIIRSLSGMPQDPTVNWPIRRPQELVVIPEKLQVGGLRFGDHLSAAELVGKPESVSWIGSDYCQLLYREGGFQLDFDHQRFCYAAIFLDRHQAEPESCYAFASPQVIPSGGGSVALSNRWQAADLVEVFGQPGEIDDDDEETLLVYRAESLTMEFELKPEAHTLARWNLFPPD